MEKFHLYGENNQNIIIQLDKVIGVPDITSISGGYDVDGSNNNINGLHVKLIKATYIYQIKR